MAKRTKCGLFNLSCVCKEAIVFQAPENTVLPKDKQFSFSFQPICNTVCLVSTADVSVKAELSIDVKFTIHREEYLRDTLLRSR